MTVIAVASTKGGVGKSTLTAAISVALQQAGRSVLVADLDFGQRSISNFVAQRDQDPDSATGGSIRLAGVEPDYSLAPTERQAALTRALEGLFQDCQSVADITLIDLPAGAGMPLAMGLDHADIVLTPMNESLMDLYTLENGTGVPGPLGKQINRARKRRQEDGRKPFHWAVVLNRVPHLANRNADKVGATLSDYSSRWGFAVAGRICDRVAFRDAYDEGLTLLDRSADAVGSIENGRRELAGVLSNLGLMAVPAQGDARASG